MDASDLHPEIPRFIRPAQVCEMLACGRTHLFNLVKSGELVPVQISRHYTVFLYSEVLAWMNARLAERAELTEKMKARKSAIDLKKQIKEQGKRELSDAIGALQKRKAKLKDE